MLKMEAKGAINEKIKTIFQSYLPEIEIVKIIDHYWNKSKVYNESDNYIQNLIPYIELWYDHFAFRVIHSEIMKYMQNELNKEQLEERIKLKGDIWFNFNDFLKSVIQIEDFDEFDLEFIKIIQNSTIFHPSNSHNSVLLANLTSISLMMEDNQNLYFDTIKNRDFLSFIKIFKRSFGDLFPLFEKSCLVLNKWTEKVNPKKRKCRESNIWNILNFKSLKTDFPKLHKMVDRIRFVKNALLSHGSFVLPYMASNFSPNDLTSFLSIKVLFYSDKVGQEKREQEAEKRKCKPEDILEIEELTVQDLIDISETLAGFIDILRAFCQCKLGLWEFKNMKKSD